MAIFNDDYLYDDQRKQTFKSLCYVKEKVGSVITRLADVERDELRPFKEDQDLPRKFGNRKNLYHDHALPVGFVGIIEWTVEPNKNDPSNDYVSWEKSQETPILICQAPSTRNVEEVKEKLKVGVSVNAKGNVRALFVPSQSYQNLGRGFSYADGALCTFEECDFDDNNGETVWKLKPETTSLPIYKISSRQTIEVAVDGLKNPFRFVNFLNLGSPNKYIDVKTPKEMVFDVLKERWPKTVNAATDITRGQKQLIKRCFDNLPVDLIVEETARRCKCSLEKAATYLEEARRHYDGWLGATSEDLKTFVEFLEYDDELREQYYDLWRKRLREQLETEENKTKAAEKELQDVLEEKKRVEEERDALIDAKERLNGEITELQLENERKKNALRQIENELSETIQREWSAAEENAAEFWAKKFVFSQGIRRDGAYNAGDGQGVRKSSLFTPGVAFALETEKNDEKSPAKTLAERLEKQIESDFIKEMTSFLMAAFSRREPLILAGPCGERIVDAVAAVRGRRPGTLRCDGDWNEGAVAQAEGGDDEIILVKNALDSRWVDRWPDAISQASKQWILTTPCAEDLTLLPQGFYNYFTPLLTEIVVAGVNAKGKRGSDSLDSADEGAKGSAFDFGDETFVKMRASAFYCKRLKATLERAYQGGRKEFQFDEKVKTRLTLLFGVAPFAYATGNLDVLRETFEEEREELDNKTCAAISRLLGEVD